MSIALTIPNGLRVRHETIYIDFYFMGKRFREAVAGIAKVNKQSISYCNNKRRAILVEIKENRFDFVSHFPDSSNIAFFDNNSKDVDRTVEQGITNWLEIQEVKKAASTYLNYVSQSKPFHKEFGDVKIAKLTKSQMEKFQTNLLKTYSPKSVNNMFTVVRGVFDDAYVDGVIQKNPLTRINNIDIETESIADPFERSELDVLEKMTKDYPYEISMIMFCCWTGLSTSEAFGLAWEDVDLDNWQVTINRARVCPNFKVPKERSRMRVIHLIEPAQKWLAELYKLSFKKPTEEIEVIQRDNITKRKEDVRFIFLNPNTESFWTRPTWYKKWTIIMEESELRIRTPNQCRHTFASQLLTAYVPQEWIAQQMGHTDTSMLKKHYGKWIQKDAPDMTQIVSKQLGFKGKKTRTIAD